MHSFGTPVVKLQNPAVNHVTIASASSHAYARLDSENSAHHYNFEPAHFFLSSTASNHHRYSHHTHYITTLPS